MLGVDRSCLSQLDGRAVALVIRVANDHVDVHIARLEMQIVVGVRVRREPVVAFDVLSVGLKTREHVVFQVRHGFPKGLDDLEVLVVHPDAALKIPLIFLDFLRSDIEDVGA